MQPSRTMRLPEAEKYVTERLGISTLELCDCTVMRRLREEMDVGVITTVPGPAKDLEAKARISELLGIRINCVEL